MARRRRVVTGPIEYTDRPSNLKRHTDDGETWLDPDGNPPVEDKDGRLLQPFIFQLGNGARERWMPPLKLPQAPAPYARFVAEMEARHAKQQKVAGK